MICREILLESFLDLISIHKTRFMKTTAILIFASLIFFSCNTDTPSQQDQEKANYEQLKKNLVEKEKNNPLLFLTVTSRQHKNLIGQTVIKGELRNTASGATYKDPQLKIDFYSATKTLLESDNETVYVEIKPGSVEKFKTKYFAPKGTDSVSIAVISAGKME